MKLHDDSGECLIQPGDFVLVNPLSVIWDHNITYDDPIYAYQDSLNTSFTSKYEAMSLQVCIICFKDYQRS